MMVCSLWSLALLAEECFVCVCVVCVCVVCVFFLPKKKLHCLPITLLGGLRNKKDSRHKNKRCLGH